MKKGPIKTVVLALAVLVLVGGAFWGGIAYQAAKGPSGIAGANGQGVRGGGPMANLSEEEQAKLESMTDEERQAYMEEKFGAAGAGQGGPARGGSLEGQVLEVASDTITVQIGTGSQTFYTDENTVVAYEKGAGDLAEGAKVMVSAQPATDGVTTASLVVVTAE